MGEINSVSANNMGTDGRRCSSDDFSDWLMNFGAVTQSTNGQFVLQDSLIRKMLRDSRNNKMMFSLIVATIWESSLAAMGRVCKTCAFSLRWFESNLSHQIGESFNDKTLVSKTSR